jgi:hypothetical protein
MPAVKRSKRSSVSTQVYTGTPRGSKQNGQDTSTFRFSKKNSGWLGLERNYTLPGELNPILEPKEDVEMEDSMIDNPATPTSDIEIDYNEAPDYPSTIPNLTATEARGRQKRKTRVVRIVFTHSEYC